MKKQTPKSNWKGDWKSQDLLELARSYPSGACDNIFAEILQTLMDKAGLELQTRTEEVLYSHGRTSEINRFRVRHTTIGYMKNKKESDE